MKSAFWRGFEKRAGGSGYDASDSGSAAAASTIAGAFGGGNKAPPPPPPPPPSNDTGSFAGNMTASIMRRIGG